MEVMGAEVTGRIELRLAGEAGAELMTALLLEPSESGVKWLLNQGCRPPSRELSFLRRKLSGKPLRCATGGRSSAESNPLKSGKTKG